MKYQVAQIIKSFSVIGLALLALALSACEPSTAQQSNEPALRTVRLETVGAASSSGQRRFVGRVEALSTVDLSFQVGGLINSMPVQQGSIVPRGDLIAALDQTDYELSTSEARVALELAELDHDRNRRMLDSGAIPQATFDRTQADMEMRRLNLDAAERNLAYTTLEAPFDALITRRLIDPFTQVQAGTPVVRVQNVDELRVYISVPETLMNALQAPESFDVMAELSAFPGRQFPLTYREHATEADPVTQTYEVQFGLQRQEGVTLLPGMTASVLVRSRTGGASSSTIEVPASALDTAADGRFQVWVYDPSNQQVEPRTVTAGPLGSSRVAIIDGLQAGEQIVTAGAHLLREGMRVTPYTP